MAFTAITSAQVDADSPITETLMQLIRTNFDDLKTLHDAHDHTGGDGGLIVDAAHTPITAGSTYLSAWTGVGEMSEGGGSLILQVESDNFNRVVIERDGIYEVDFNMKASGGGTANARIYKNGVAFGTTQSTASAGYVLKSEDLTLSEGDYLDLYLQITGGGTTADAKDFKVSAAVKQLG